MFRSLPALHLYGSKSAFYILSAKTFRSNESRQALRVIDNLMERPGYTIHLEWDITQSDRSDQWQSHSPDETIDIALAWLKKVEEKTGREPVVYTAKIWWRERQIPEENFGKLSHYKVWIADYSRSARATETPPTINQSHWDLWQFSETAELSQGYDGPVDANIYKGTEDQFAANFQIAQN